MGSADVVPGFAVRDPVVKELLAASTIELTETDRDVQTIMTPTMEELDPIICYFRTSHIICCPLRSNNPNNSNTTVYLRFTNLQTTVIDSQHCLEFPHANPCLTGNTP